jgi:hypothetical protein
MSDAMLARNTNTTASVARKNLAKRLEELLGCDIVAPSLVRNEEEELERKRLELNKTIKTAKKSLTMIAKQDNAKKNG